LTPKNYWENEEMSNNPETLDRVIKNAEEHGEIPTKTTVLNTIRVEKMREKDSERVIKKNDKLVKDIPKAVKDYFNAMADFKDELKLACEVARRDLFSPESINIIKKKHEEIRNVMDELEGEII